MWATQAEHGWSSYVVVFQLLLKLEDAEAYCLAGLVFCTEATLPHLLATINLCAHDVPFPFAFHTTKYSVTVQPGPMLTPEARRVVFDAPVASENATRYASATKAAADRATGELSS